MREEDKLPPFSVHPAPGSSTQEHQEAESSPRRPTLTMPLARPRANSLSIPIPATGLWRLQRPPTPRRATYPLSIGDTPPAPSLSSWDPETPSPLPAGEPSMPPTNTPLLLQISPSLQQTPIISPTRTPSFCCFQTKEAIMAREQAVVAISPAGPRLLLPPASLYTVVSPYSPTSPRSPQFLYSPTSPTSLQSTYNPFLSPPQPRLTTTFFRLASPLLPASPLSIFDRTVSPTSPTFLLSRTPSPGTPNWQPTFLRTATLSMAECSAWDRLSPTFLWPRTPPAIPPISPSSAEHCDAVESVEASEWRYPFAAPPVAPPSTTMDEGERLETADAQRKKMKIEFYHFLAAKRAAAMNSLSVSTLVKSEKSRRAKLWKKLLPRVKVKAINGLSSRSGWFRVGGGVGPRA